MKEVSKQYSLLFFQVQWGTRSQTKGINSADAKFCSHSYFKWYHLKLASLRYCCGELPFVKWEYQQNTCYRILIMWTPVLVWQARVAMRLLSLGRRICCGLFLIRIKSQDRRSHPFPIYWNVDLTIYHWYYINCVFLWAWWVADGWHWNDIKHIVGKTPRKIHEGEKM